MWRQDDLVVTLTASLGRPTRRGRHDRRSPGHVHDSRDASFLPACPLMHGTGNFPCSARSPAAAAWSRSTNRTFDPVELLDTIEREGVNSISIVGDAFAKPILRALDANQGRWDLTSLVGIVSSGVMWSKESKAGPPRSSPRHGADGRVRLVRGPGDGVVGLGGRRRRRDGEVRAEPRDDRDRRSEPSTSSRGAARSAGSRSADASRSATTRIPRSRRAPSSRSTASAIRARATSRRSTPTARSRCSGAGRCASTRAARRSSPRRSRRR